MFLPPATAPPAQPVGITDAYSSTWHLHGGDLNLGNHACIISMLSAELSFKFFIYIYRNIFRIKFHHFVFLHQIFTKLINKSKPVPASNMGNVVHYYIVIIVNRTEVQYLLQNLGLENCLYYVLFYCQLLRETIWSRQPYCIFFQITVCHSLNSFF